MSVTLYDARHRKPRRFVYALNLGGTGITPPDKSPPGQKSPGPGHPTSGDIFYCSGSRQLNHSGLFIVLCSDSLVIITVIAVVFGVLIFLIGLICVRRYSHCVLV